MVTHHGQDGRAVGEHHTLHAQAQDIGRAPLQNANGDAGLGQQQHACIGELAKAGRRLQPHGCPTELIEKAALHQGEQGLGVGKARHQIEELARLPVNDPTQQDGL